MGAGLRCGLPIWSRRHQFPQLIVNGDGSSVSGWTAQNSASLSSVAGRIRVTSTLSSPNPFCYQTLPTVVGATYCVSANVYNGSGTAKINITDDTPGNAHYGNVNSGVGKSMTFVADAATAYVALVANISAVGQYAEFSDISMRRLR